MQNLLHIRRSYPKNAYVANLKVENVKFISELLNGYLNDAVAQWDYFLKAIQLNLFHGHYVQK